MKRRIKDVIIIGAGPSGAVLFSKLKTRKNIGVSLIDKYKSPFLKLKKMGVFYENFNAKTPAEYKFLVDGTKNGKDIANYIKSSIGNLKIEKFDITSIEKVKELFVLSGKNGDKVLTKKVILATGLRAKNLPLSFRKKSDISKQKISDYINKVDASEKDVVFIGSGDNVAFKALKVCKFFSKNNIDISGSVKIFARNNFYQRINPIFMRELRSFERKGILDLKLGNFEIKNVSYNKQNYISSLDFGDFVYKPSSKNGAVVCVCIGFEPNLPALINCDVSDVCVVGDLHSWYSGNAISIFNSINSVNIIFNRIILK